MRCDFCNSSRTYTLKVEGDVGADAIWCDECYSNFDIYNMPISKSLRAELIKWAQQYGEWIDWSKDELYQNGIEMEEDHNQSGILLTAEVRKELGETYTVKFSPSSSAKMYVRTKFIF